MKSVLRKQGGWIKKLSGTYIKPKGDRIYMYKMGQKNGKPSFKSTRQWMLKSDFKDLQKDATFGRNKYITVSGKRERGAHKVEIKQIVIERSDLITDKKEKRGLVIRYSTQTQHKEVSRMFQRKTLRGAKVIGEKGKERYVVDFEDFKKNLWDKFGMKAGKGDTPK